MQTVDKKATLAEVHELIRELRDEKVSRRLDHIYRQIPANDCQRCADCCFSCAQVHPIEFLHVFDHVLSFSELGQARLAKRVIEYELLNLESLDVKCPFLEEKECVLYERRPLQCREVGLYPADEYRAMVEDSRRENEKLAMYYARHERILLREEVMQYDIDQCDNNRDKSGKLVVLGKREREHLHSQLFELGLALLPDEWASPEPVMFSTQFSQLFFDADEFQELKVKVIKEHQSGSKRTTLDKVLNSSGLKF